MCLAAGLTACADDTPAATPAPVITISPTPSLADDPPGTATCTLLSAAIKDGTLMEPGVTETVVAAAGTADAPLADAAQRLSAAHTAAVAATGKANEPDAVAAVSESGTEMFKVCDDYGLETVG